MKRDTKMEKRDTEGEISYLIREMACLPIPLPSALDSALFMSTKKVGLLVSWSVRRLVSQLVSGTDSRSVGSLFFIDKKLTACT